MKPEYSKWQTKKSIEKSRMFTISTGQLPMESKQQPRRATILFCYGYQDTYSYFDIVLLPTQYATFDYNNVPEKIKAYWDIPQVTQLSNVSSSSNTSSVTGVSDSRGITTGTIHHKAVTPIRGSFSQMTTNWITTFCRTFKATDHLQFIKSFPPVRVTTFFSKVHDMYGPTRYERIRQSDHTSFNLTKLDISLSCYTYLEYLTVSNYTTEACPCPSISQNDSVRFFVSKSIQYIDLMAEQLDVFITTIVSDHNKIYSTKLCDEHDFLKYLGLLGSPFDQFTNFENWYCHNPAVQISIKRAANYKEHVFQNAFEVSAKNLMTVRNEHVHASKVSKPFHSSPAEILLWMSFVAAVSKGQPASTSQHLSSNWYHSHL